MARKPIAQGIGKLIKAGLRKAYQGKTAPLQAGSKLANRLAPNSKVAATLAAIASPAMLQEGPTAPTNQNTPKETAPRTSSSKKKFKAMQPTEARLQLGSVPDQDIGSWWWNSIDALSILIYLDKI
jgi:hypothetical protein